MIDSDFLSEASRIVGAGEERGIILRLMGKCSEIALSEVCTNTRKNA
jgi:hypothetical protein